MEGKRKTGRRQIQANSLSWRKKDVPQNCFEQGFVRKGKFNSGNESRTKAIYNICE